MGDMKNPGRGIPVVYGEAQDPSDELANLFEAELATDPMFAQASFVRPVIDDRYAAGSPNARNRVESAGRSAPLVPDDQDFDAAFDLAFGDEFASEPAAPAPALRHGVTPVKQEAADAYQSWIVPRGTRPAVAPSRPAHAAAAATTVSHRRSGYAGRSLGADLETAIHGLSAPANPRDVIIVETQSFAPERVVDDYRHEPAMPELDEFDELIASELAVMSEPIHGANHAYPAFYQQNAGPAQSYEAGDPSGAFDDGYAAEELPQAPVRRSSFRRTAVALGGGALSLALIGAVGLFVWNGGAADAGLQASNEPLLIKADNEPFKTVPVDPGGRTVPNQNKAVYNRVNGSAAQPSTTQHALLTDAEEPMDLPVEEEPAAYANLPGVDPVGEQTSESDGSEERLETASADAPAAPAESPVPVLQPRKVRTMVVRPDGTIAPEAEAAPAPAAVATTAAAAPAVAAAPTPTRIAEATPAPAAPLKPVVAKPVAAAPTPAPVRHAAAPVTEPAVGVPTQVADPIEVAAIAPRPAQAAPLPTGGYFVQISSQPSEAAAQQSMRSLSAKFADVISARSLGIQSAEIPGKGTFYRVRVAAASKEEASEICGRLKAAGGNCFVAR